MVKDTLDSVFENLKERTTNPFLGTLIVVWIIKNWKLVYSLLYFDGSFKLKDRLDYITQYFSERSFYWNMLGVVFITMIVLLTTYALLTISRLLTDFYERVVLPWVSEVTDKSTVILKTEHNKVLEEVKYLQTRLEEERLAKVAAQNERDQADERILKLTTVKKEEEEVSATPSSSARTTEIEEDDHSFFVRVADQLKEVGVLESTNVLRKIKNSNSISVHDEVIDILMLEDLITLNATGGDNYAFYDFNEQGTRFLKFWNRFKKDLLDQP